VPARFHLQIHAGPNRVAGFGGVGGQNQFRLRMRGVRGQSRETKADGKKDSDASHMDKMPELGKNSK
jgi:hypothetical protein